MPTNWSAMAVAPTWNAMVGGDDYPVVAHLFAIEDALFLCFYVLESLLGLCFMNFIAAAHFHVNLRVILSAYPVYTNLYAITRLLVHFLFRLTENQKSDRTALNYVALALGNINVISELGMITVMFMIVVERQVATTFVRSYEHRAKVLGVTFVVGSAIFSIPAGLLKNWYFQQSYWNSKTSLQSPIATEAVPFVPLLNYSWALIMGSCAAIWFWSLQRTNIEALTDGLGREGLSTRYQRKENRDTIRVFCATLMGYLVTCVVGVVGSFVRVRLAEQMGPAHVLTRISLTFLYLIIDIYVCFYYGFVLWLYSAFPIRCYESRRGRHPTAPVMAFDAAAESAVHFETLARVWDIEYSQKK